MDENKYESEHYKADMLPCHRSKCALEEVDGDLAMRIPVDLLSLIHRDDTYVSTMTQPSILLPFSFLTILYDEFKGTCKILFLSQY